MYNLNMMSREERSLLVYFESCSVDGYAKIDQRRLNDDDRKIAERWKEAGFIQYGRVKAKAIEASATKLTHYAVLSDAAWTLAHQERRNRATRTIILENFSIR